MVTYRHPPVLAIPRKVTDAIRSLHYILYTALSAAAREKAERGEDELVFTANGTLTPKGLDCRNERLITFPQWQAASTAVLNETHKVWGAARSIPLSLHHGNVVNPTNTHGWDIALEYDIRQRTAASVDKRHDLSTVDTIALTTIATELMLRRPATANSTYIPTTASPKRQLPIDHDSASFTPRKRSRFEGGRCF